MLTAYSHRVSYEVPVGEWNGMYLKLVLPPPLLVLLVGVWNGIWVLLESQRLGSPTYEYVERSQKPFSVLWTDKVLPIVCGTEWLIEKKQFVDVSCTCECVERSSTVLAQFSGSTCRCRTEYTTTQNII